MRATWYKLEDGTAVDPNEVTRDDSGALVHKSGKVALGDHGNYLTIGVDLDQSGGRAGAAPEVKTTKGKGRAMKPDDLDGGYKTRETKAD